MKILLVHPSSLLYSEGYLRLEPLGLDVAINLIADPGWPPGARPNQFTQDALQVHQGL